MFQIGTGRQPIGFIDLPEDESCGIPNLGCKSSIGVEQFIRNSNVRTRRAHAGQSKADGIRAEAVADLQRIHSIAFRFRHFLALGIANDSGDVDSFERDILHELQAEHHHACDPKENDVVGGNEQCGRIKRFQIVGLIRPTESRERPQTGTEPRIEHVLILPDFRRGALRAAIQICSRNSDFAALVAIPRGDTVSPP